MVVRELSFAGVRAKLKGLAGQRVDLSISGVEDEPPLLAYVEDSALSVLDEPSYDEEIRQVLEWHRDTLQIAVGPVNLLLHPDHLVEATWVEGDPGPGQVRQLTVVFDRTQVEIRIGPF